MNIYKEMGQRPVKTVSEMKTRMAELGASAAEQEETVRWVRLFIAWCGEEGLRADRSAGVRWLKGVPVSGEDGVCRMAALGTFMHLTGQAKGSEDGPSGAEQRNLTEQPKAQMAEGSTELPLKRGPAETWGEAGARWKGYLSCKGYARKTVESYVGWGRRFYKWHGAAGSGIPVGGVDGEMLRRFLEYLASTNVVSKTQNQALNALVNFYRHGLGVEVGELGDYLRAKVSRRLPTVLTAGEATAVMQDLKAKGGPMWLMAGLMLGSGLRQAELLELRVKDLDLERGILTVRMGKGNKDRRTMIPDKLKAGLQEHFLARRAEYERDVLAGAGYVPLPGGLERKHPAAARSWGWQYVFGGQNVIEDRETGRKIRWHLHEKTVGRLLGASGRRCGVARAVTCHSLRHTFATLALAGGTDIRTLQELLGHSDVKTTMIYTHVLNRPGVAARSPLDALAA